MKNLAIALTIVGFLVTGCTTPPPPKEEPPQPERLAQQVARETLERAHQAYDAGDYTKVLTMLRGSGASVFDAAEPATRLEAMKLEAFSYCVNNQLPECRAQFRRTLDAFPKFELTVAERNHPIWGPAFEDAKRQKR